MTQPILLTGQVYAVEVPDPINAIISGHVITWKKGDAQGRGFMALPAGNWQLICTTKAVTRMQASEIIEHDDDGWKDYDTDNFLHDFPFLDPLDSLRSLLTSKGLDMEKNYVIIKKVS